MRFLLGTVVVVQPLLLAATLAALHVAHSARSAPGTGSELHLANETAPAGSNHSINARRLHDYGNFDINRWCPQGGSVYTYGCNLLGYTHADIPEGITTPIAMVGGLGGAAVHVSFCNIPEEELKYAEKIQIFTDQETHRDINYIDQITVTWSDGSKTRIGGCDRPGNPGRDCDGAMQRTSDMYEIDLSGERRVKSYQMAVDGRKARNIGQIGQLLGSLSMELSVPSTGQTEQQGYNSCCAGDVYKFTSEKSVGSGIICGITYRGGSKVDAFGVVFYKPLSMVQRRILTLPTHLRDTPDYNITFTARGPCATGPGYSFGSSAVWVGHNTATTTSYSSSHTLAIGLKFGMSMSLTQDLVVASSTVAFNFDISVSYTQMWSWTDTETKGATYTTIQVVNQICPTYLNACGVAPQTPLQPGDCCQWYTSQGLVKADEAQWFGQINMTFKDTYGNEFYHIVPTSGTIKVESWAAEIRSGYYCQSLPSHLSNCNQLPIWYPGLEACHAI